MGRVVADARKRAFKSLDVLGKLQEPTAVGPRKICGGERPRRQHTTSLARCHSDALERLRRPGSVRISTIAATLAGAAAILAAAAPAVRYGSDAVVWESTSTLVALAALACIAAAAAYAASVCAA